MRSKPFRLLLSGIFLLGVALNSGFHLSEAHAQETPNCAEPTTQSEMTECAGLDYEKADGELNAEYQKIRKVLKDRDKASDDSSDSAADALVASQRAWVAFRDANCEVAGFQARGGSMEPMLVSTCLADMSRKRSEELRNLSEGF